MDDALVFSDAGIDDIVAIDYLMSQNLRIQGIVAVAGLWSSTKAYDILDLFFKDKAPIMLSAVEEGHSPQLYPAFASNIASTNDIRNLLSDGCHEQGNVETLVSFGPLTHVSKFLKAGGTVKKMLIMGGAHRCAGNETSSAEYNFQCDPHAARQVLHHGVPVTIAPLDITGQVRFGRSFVEQITSDALRDVLRRVLEHYLTLGEEDIPLHDLTAALFMKAPQLFLTAPRYTDVVTEGPHRGMLVVDEHRYNRALPNAHLLAGIDVIAARCFLTRALCGGGGS